MIEYVFVVVVIVVAVLAMTVINREPKTDPTAHILKKGKGGKGKSKKQKSANSPSDSPAPEMKGKKKENGANNNKQQQQQQKKKQETVVVDEKKGKKQNKTAQKSASAPATPLDTEKKGKKTADKAKNVQKEETQQKQSSQKKDKKPAKEAESTPAAAVPSATTGKKKNKKKKPTKESTKPKMEEVVDDGFSVVGKKKDKSKTPVTPSEDVKAKNDQPESKKEKSASTPAPSMRSTVSTFRSAGISARNPNFIENPYRTEAEFWASASVAPQKRRESPIPKKKQDSPTESAGHAELPNQESEDAQKLAEQVLGRETKSAPSKAAQAPSVKVFRSIGNTKYNPWSSVDNEEAPVEMEFLGTPTEEYFPKLGEKPRKSSQRKGKATQSSETSQQEQEPVETTEEEEEDTADRETEEVDDDEEDGPSMATSSNKRESDMVFEFENQAPVEKRPKRDPEQMAHQATNGALTEQQEVEVEGEEEE